MRFTSKGLSLLPIFLCAAAGQSMRKLIPDSERDRPQDFTLQVTYGDRYIGSGGTLTGQDGTHPKIPLGLMQEVPSMSLKPFYESDSDMMDLPKLDGKFIVIMLQKSPAEVDEVSWAVSYLHHNYEATYESKENYVSSDDQLYLINTDGYPPVPYNSPTIPAIYKFIIYRQPKPFKSLTVDLGDFNQHEFEVDNGLEPPAAKSVTFDTYEYGY